MQIAITLGLSRSSAITILGSATVGSILSPSRIPLTGTSPITYRIQWLRNGAAIAGAVSADYTTQAADIGSSVSLQLSLPDGTVLTSDNAVTVQSAGTVPSGGGTLTLADFSRDGVVYDSGAAFGSNAGLVPLSGTADPGAAVQYRIVTETGTQVQGWADLATAAGTGDWSGTAVTPRNSARLRPEVRLTASPTVTATTTKCFYVGHVIDIWGQSELHRSVLGAYPGATPPPAIADAAALQVSYSDATGASYGTALAHGFVDGSNANLAGKLGALANMLAAERPGERFHLVMHTLSATGVRTALDDASTGRMWSSEVAIRDFALADGQYPGLAIQSWYNADAAALGTGFGDFWLTAISGLLSNGTPHTRGSAAPAGGSNMDHYFADWYDYARTKWAMAGPHRFETALFDANIQNNRVSLNAAFANPILSSRAVRVLEPLSYQNDPGAGYADPGDPIHPGTTDPDGMSRFMVQIGYGILQGLGISPRGVPKLDQWSYDAPTSTLTIGSSAGALTTTRRVRGGTLPAGRPMVDNIFRNGALVPAADLSFVGGTIRVANVAAGDSVAVGLGGIGTGGTTTEDINALDDETWQDWPIVAGGLAYSGMEGLPVSGYAVCPTGVIPAVSLPADPNTKPNLAAGSAFALFAVGVDGGSTGLTTNGWKSGKGGWVFNGNGSAQIAGGYNDVATGELWRVLTDGSGIDFTTLLAGAAAELAFVVSSPDGGSGDVNVVVSMQNGGTGVTYYSVAPTFSVTSTPTLVKLPLGVLAANRNKLRVTITRQSGATGTLRIERLTLKAV